MNGTMFYPSGAIGRRMSRDMGLIVDIILQRKRLKIHMRYYTPSSLHKHEIHKMSGLLVRSFIYLDEY